MENISKLTDQQIKFCDKFFSILKNKCDINPEDSIIINNKYSIVIEHVKEFMNNKNIKYSFWTSMNVGADIITILLFITKKINRYTPLYNIVNKLIFVIMSIACNIISGLIIITNKKQDTNNNDNSKIVKDKYLVLQGNIGEIMNGTQKICINSITDIVINALSIVLITTKQTNSDVFIHSFVKHIISFILIFTFSIIYALIFFMNMLTPIKKIICTINYSIKDYINKLFFYDDIKNVELNSLSKLFAE
jgi:hypothetical protein